MRRHGESSRRAQDAGARGRAAALDTGTEPARGVAPGEDREVISASTPSPLPPTQERPAPAENLDSISFATALALVSGQNPQIAFANEQINEAFAQLRGARVLWLPSIRAGLSYTHHEGPIQANDGTISQSSRSALEAGLGTLAVGGGSPAVPGVTANFRLSDAVFQPRVAGQQVAARQHAATTTNHDLLLFVAVAYLDLLRAFQQQAISQETLGYAEQLAELTAAFARAGLGNQADADRAQTELAVRKNAVAQATVQTQIASARLVELLNLQSNRVLVPEEPTLAQIELVSREMNPTQLLAEGLSRRPELAESRHLVAEAVQRLDRERYAPLLPSVILGVSQGGYGGGPASTVADFRGRFDLDATAYWELRNFGAGKGRPAKPLVHGWSRPGSSRYGSWTGWLARLRRRMPSANPSRARLPWRSRAFASPATLTGGTWNASGAVKDCRSKCSSRSKRSTKAAANTCEQSAIMTSGNSGSTARWAVPSLAS